jgi:hypothetical protein
MSVKHSFSPRVFSAAGLMALALSGLSSFEASGQIVFGNNSNSLILNSDASLDTDGDNRFEDLSGVSGLDFQLNTTGGNNARVLGTSSLPGITAAYDFIGSGGVIGSTGQAGMQLTLEGTGTIRSFQTLNYNPPDNDASNESVTLELWFKPDDLAGNEVLWEDGGGTGMGLFLNGSTLEVRKLPGSGLITSVDMTTLSGGGLSDFTQAVVQFNTGPNPDQISFYVNGQAVATGVSAGNNGADWSGGDPFGLGTRGGANMGGIGGGSSGQSSFEGEMAIFRAYRADLLTADQIARNYTLISGQTVTGQNITLFNGTSGTTWNAAGSWSNGLPVAGDSMTVINNSNNVIVSDAGMVANTLFVGSDIGIVGAPAGAGDLDVTGGDLTVTTNLNIGGIGAGTEGDVSVSGGDLNVQGNVNFDVMGSANTGNLLTVNGGTLNVTGDVVFDPANLNNGSDGNNGGGTLAVSSGTANISSLVTSDGGSSTVSISGGQLVFTGGQVASRRVDTLNLTGTGDLEFTLARASGFTPLTVIGTATTADTPTITVGTAADPVAAPLSETTAGNGIIWVAATPGDWSDGAPDGTAAFANGTVLDLLTAGTLTGPVPTSGDPNWTISVDGGNPNKLVATRTGGDLNLGPVQAIIDASSGTVTRNTAITIAEAPASIGAAAARLSIRDTGVLNVNTDLQIGNAGGSGLVTVGTAGGVSAPDLNVTGNVQFGGAAGEFGGELAVDEGTANITGNIIKAAPSVGDSIVSLSGGSLTFNNLIDVDFFYLGSKQDQSGTFTLSAGETLNTSQQMVVGRIGEGDFVNDGATVTGNQLIVGSADNFLSEGSADNSSYIQNSGTSTFNGFVHLGDDPAGNGADGAALTILGGTFTAGGGLRAAHSNNSGQGGLRSTITVGGSGLNPTVIVSGGNLETAENHLGTFNLEDGTVFIETNNLIIGQGNASNSDTNLNGGVMDLRSQSGTATTLDVNYNNGTGTLTVNSGADLFVSRNINMGSQTGNNAARTNRLEIFGGDVFVRDDINTRNNGTAGGNKADVIDIDSGNLIFGQGFAAGADGAEGNAIRFEANPGQAGVNTFNVFDWSGGTITGLDSVIGIANLTGTDAGAPLNTSESQLFRQKGGTFVLEAGTTTFDGNVGIDAAATWQVTLTADDSLANTPNPTPNRAAFIEANGNEAVLSGNIESFLFSDGWTLDLRGSGGAGDTTGGSAVTFDAGSSLVWDGTTANWTTDTLPSGSASGQVAAVNDQFVIAESAEGSISINTVATNLVDTDWTLSLATNDPNILGLVDNQLVATRINQPLVGLAAGLAIIDGTAGGIVQRNSDLLISTEASAGADAAALQIDAQGLDVTGSFNLIIGSGASGDSFVNQNGGAVTVGGNLIFGQEVGEAGGEYNLTGGTLAVTGNVLSNAPGENGDINFDGGSATFGGTVDVEDLGVGRKFGTNGTLALTSQTFGVSDDFIIGGSGTGVATLNAGSVVNVGDDVILGQGAAGNGTLNILGDGSLGSTLDDLLIGDLGTGVVNVGDNTAGTQPTLQFTRADVGAQSGSDGTLNIVNGSYTGTGGMVVARDAGSMGGIVIGDGTVNSNPLINISGGNTETANGGTGTITVNSGTYNQNSNNLIVGQVDGSVAVFNVNGGSVNVTNQLRTNGGSGTVNVSGGTLTVNGVTDLGNNGGNDGGTINVSGTGVFQLNNQLIVGNAGTFDVPSAVNATGGDLNVTGNLTVGAGGEGSLSLTGVNGGEEHDLTGIIIVGAQNNGTSKGTVTIDMANPGDVVNTGQFRLGSNGQSQMNLIEGTLNVTGSFNVAYGAASSAANSRTAMLTIGDGTSTPTLNVAGGNFEAALAGTGMTTIKSGTYNQNTSNLIVGQNSGSNATFVVENGDVNIAGAGIIRIGNQSGATGAFEVQNGTVDAGSLDFGANHAAGTASTNVGSYTQSGGVVTVGDFNIANGGNTIAVSGGTLNVNNMNFDTDALDVGSTFDFSGGTVSLNGSMNFRAGQTDVTVRDMADLDIGGSLNFNNGGTMANPNKFLITGNTATLDVTQNFTMTGTDQRVLTFEALAASLTPVSTLNVSGDVSVGGTLELIGFDLLDWSSIFGGGTGTVTLINNLGENSVANLFQQTNGSVWNEGAAWIGDPQWTLSYMGGAGSNDVVLNYTIIPEPSRAVLLALGLTGLLMRRRRKSA